MKLTKEIRSTLELLVELIREDIANDAKSKKAVVKVKDTSELKLGDLVFSDKTRVQGKIVGSLRRNGVDTIKRLIKCKKVKLLSFKGLALGSVDLIIATLDSHGLSLKK